MNLPWTYPVTLNLVPILTVQNRAEALAALTELFRENGMRASL